MHSDCCHYLNRAAPVDFWTRCGSVFNVIVTITSSSQYLHSLHFQLRVLFTTPHTFVIWKSSILLEPFLFLISINNLLAAAYSFLHPFLPIFPLLTFSTTLKFPLHQVVIKTHSRIWISPPPNGVQNQFYMVLTLTSLMNLILMFLIDIEFVIMSCHLSDKVWICTTLLWISLPFLESI